MIINYDITKKNISYIFHFFFLHIFFFFTWSNPHAVLCYKAEAQASFCSTKGERDWMSDSQRTRGLAAFFLGGGVFFFFFFLWYNLFPSIIHDQCIFRKNVGTQEEEEKFVVTLTVLRLSRVRPSKEI